MPQINTKISDETYRQIRWLREHRSYSLRDVMTIAVDRIYREQETNMIRITAAQCIRPYVAPQYVVQPVGPSCDANALQILNAHAWTTIKSRVLSLPPYNCIIEHRHTHYLARVEKIADPNTALRAAVEQAIRECEHWMNGAAVIRCADGTIEAVPNLPPLRDDVVATILELTDPHDIAGYDCELERDEHGDLTDKMVAWIADIFLDNYQPD